MKLNDVSLFYGNLAFFNGAFDLTDVQAYLEALDKIGSRSVLLFGGTLFRKNLLQFAKSPFALLRELKAPLKTTPLAASVDCQGVIDDTSSAPKETLQAFIETAKDAGVDIFRLSHSKNDSDSLKTALEFVKKAKAKACVAIDITQPLLKDLKSLEDLAASIAKAGSDSILLFDGLAALTPKNTPSVIETVKGAINDTELGLASFCHHAMAEMVYFKAKQAGADFLDCAMPPFSGGQSLPSMKAMAFALEDTGIEAAALKKAEDEANRLFETHIAIVDAKGGTQTTPSTPFKPFGKPEKEQIAKREKTPQQEKIANQKLADTDEKALLLALNAQDAAPLLRGELKPLSPLKATTRAYQITVDGIAHHVELQPSITGKKVQIKQAVSSKPKPSGRPAPATARPAPSGASAPKAAHVAKPAAAPKAQTKPASETKKPQQTPELKAPTATSAEGNDIIMSPMQGVIIKVLVDIGEKVTNGQPVAILEAMKMESKIPAPKDGEVKEVLVKEGDSVVVNQKLITLS